MPELPEVETMRRGIASVKGATIISVERTACSRKPIEVSPRIDHFNRRVAGKQITSVDRLGKRVVLRLDSDERIILEPRMTGLVLTTDPPTLEHLRFCIHLNHRQIPEILFWDRRGLGKVALWTLQQYVEKVQDGSLGPDALAISFEEFLPRFKPLSREVKVALLDQGLVAGVGNLYASEILHLAGVHPQARCNRISKARWKSIFDAMKEVLELAIKYEGSTLADGTYRNTLNQDGSFQNQHRVYDREGEICPTCRKDRIKRIVQAQRSTFFCSHCQKK
jgi:formamidopyrimidine-DNA glycosylase